MGAGRCGNIVQPAIYIYIYIYTYIYKDEKEGDTVFGDANLWKNVTFVIKVDVLNWTVYGTTDKRKIT